MSRLMRASEITKLPVVTLAGEDVAQVKDVIFSAGGGEVGGFTLAGRGRFSGPLKQALAWSEVAALGRDAMMIRDDQVLVPKSGVLDASATSGGSGGNVLGSRVLTDTGVDLGVVVDVVVEVGGAEGGTCDVVGYEVEASEALSAQGNRVLVPLPATLSVSGEHLILPESAKDFVGQNLDEFAASVHAFRTQLEGTT